MGGNSTPRFPKEYLSSPYTDWTRFREMAKRDSTEYVSGGGGGDNFIEVPVEEDVGFVLLAGEEDASCSFSIEDEGDSSSPPLFESSLLVSSSALSSLLCSSYPSSNNTSAVRSYSYPDITASNDNFAHARETCRRTLSLGHATEKSCDNPSNSKSISRVSSGDSNLSRACR